MFTKEKIIEYGNKILSGNWHPANEESLNLILDYLNNWDKNKASLMYQAYIQFPDNIKVNAISKALEYYVRKFQINTLMKINKTPFGEQKQIIKYL